MTEQDIEASTPGKLEKAKSLIDDFGENDDPDLDEVIRKIDSKLRQLEKELDIPEEDKVFN